MVDDAIAWNVFRMTGSIDDYMRFRTIKNSTIDNVQEDTEDISGNNMHENIKDSQYCSQNSFRDNNHSNHYGNTNEYTNGHSQDNA